MIINLTLIYADGRALGATMYSDRQHVDGVVLHAVESRIRALVRDRVMGDVPVIRAFIGRTEADWAAGYFREVQVDGDVLTVLQERF